MEEERTIDKLARYIINFGTFAIIAALCWYFRSVLIYIIAAFVISLIGQPIFRSLKDIRFKGRTAPDWLLSVLTLVAIFAIITIIITQVIPVVSGIIRDAAAMNTRITFDRDMLDRINEWIISVFPGVGNDFDLFSYTLARLKEVTSFSGISNVIGSVASVVASIAVGAFSIVFISFFFIKDEALFGKIIGALVPDRIEASVGKTILDIEILLSRYFVGLTVEVMGVMLLDFLGLWLIARIGVNYAIGIAFIAGILNVIPYVGPLIGEVLGVILWFFAKYLMLAFGAEPHVLELGINGIRILAFFYLFMGLNQSFSGALRGAGAAVMPMVSSLVGAFIRIPIAYFMAVQPQWQYGLFWSMVISNIISFLIVYVYFQSGKWRKNAIVVTSAKIDEE